jgi:hypothetical protein
MAQRDYSPYQQKVISRFYENRDQLDDQKLSELVTNLYLATSEKKQAKLWETAREIMTRMKLPESRIQHVITAKDPAVLAAVVQELQSGKLKRG